MQDYLQQKWQVNKAISNCTFHNTYINKYQILILLFEYQNSNKYPNESNICCSPTLYACVYLYYSFVRSQNIKVSLHKIKASVKIRIHSEAFKDQDVINCVARKFQMLKPASPIRTFQR